MFFYGSALTLTALAVTKQLARRAGMYRLGAGCAFGEAAVCGAFAVFSPTLPQLRKLAATFVIIEIRSGLRYLQRHAESTT